MNICRDRIRAFEADQRLEDSTAREAGAACTALAWLALYSIAITGSLFFGSGQHRHETPVVAAALANLEHSR